MKYCIVIECSDGEVIHDELPYQPDMYDLMHLESIYSTEVDRHNNISARTADVVTVFEMRGD